MQTAWVILVLGCSYMIYSPAFDALSQEAKDAVYRRIWEGLAANRGRIAARPSKFCARPGRDSPTTSGPERLAQGAGAAPSPSGPLAPPSAPGVVHPLRACAGEYQKRTGRRPRLETKVDLGGLGRGQRVRCARITQKHAIMML